MVVVRKRSNPYRNQDRSVMPQLEPEQYSKFNQMLEELGPCVEQMKEAPANFVRDQIVRNNEYAERTLVSPKQFAWLERLHNEFVGTSEGPGPKGVDENIRRVHDSQGAKDMDDDIPF